ncbi:hypothetical protein [Streptomyces bohaiensis]|uniref:Uncharacterized protein n=1 Tax=Streptomyces bohaiensis TaxID=1431344 RepID=A0ABX1CB74_9ACTN|nr:hypothetical protein [Streptomyces bohaiensis]NJQ16371.1 hypothetical protein [Streptomyces bohaiensis]
MSQPWPPTQRPSGPTRAGAPQAPPGAGVPGRAGPSAGQVGGPAPVPPGAVHPAAPIHPAAGYPRPVGPRTTGRLLGAAGLSLLAALVGGVCYALLVRLLFDPATSEFAVLSVVSLVLGALVALGPALLGWSAWHHGAGAALALFAVVLGDLYGLALVITLLVGDVTGVTAAELFFQRFGDLWGTWARTGGWSDVLTLLFAPAAALSVGGLCHALRRRPGAF